MTTPSKPDLAQRLLQLRSDLLDLRDARHAAMHNRGVERALGKVEEIKRGIDAKDAEIERLRARLTSSQSGLVHVIAAVERSGDRAATTAMFTALGQASGSEALTELNRLRRELADTRDELATMTAERDEKHHEAAETAVELVSAQLRAEAAERDLADLRRTCGHLTEQHQQIGDQP